MPYLSLIRRLTERGDEVFFFAKETQSARDVFQGLPVEVIALEPGFTVREERIVEADSYPDMLHNQGFQDVDLLYHRANDFAGTLLNIAPDVLIVDFAPTAMLANISLGLPIIASGSGFQVPRRSTPMPRFRYWKGSGETLARNEARVLDIANQVIVRMGGLHVNSIATLLKADCEWLTTFSELDFYGQREGGNYLGTFPVENFGDPPVWPAEGQPRVFVYLSPGPAATLALDALQQLGVAVCLYAPKLSAAEADALDPSLVHSMDSLVDIVRAGREAALFVHNGNLNTTVAALLTGTPRLAIPTTAERYLNARRLELLGAGFAAPQAVPGDIPGKLKALLSDPRYTRAASHFAEKYRAAWQADHTRPMIDDIDRLL